MINYTKKFISLDLETTHLGVEEGRIMEVGAAEAEFFFDEGEKKVKVKFGKIFDRLVNPEKEPSQTALALTGISYDELKDAPLWDGVKKDLVEFLKGATLLGQNVVFDLDFLKNQGLGQKYPFVDTLDIALTFLPLFPVHSLEYLSQEFETPKSKAHRALSDCKNTAYVLAGILNEFLGFDLTLQNSIRTILLKSRIPYKDLFLDLPEIHNKTNALVRKNNSSLPPLTAKSGEGEFLLRGGWPDKKILSLPLGFVGLEGFLQNLANDNVPGIVGVSHPDFLEIIPKEQLIPDPAWALCTKRFGWFQRQPDLSDPALKVLIKLSIFRNSTSSLDLREVKWGNLDRQIVPLITVDPLSCQAHKCTYVGMLKKSFVRVHFSSLTGIFALSRDWKISFPKTRLLLFDLPRLEEEFSEGLTQTWNLRTIRRYFLPLFPLQKGLPSRLTEMPKMVEEVVNELDLFFGILHLVYLKKDRGFSENLIIDSSERGSDRFGKFFHPASKLVTKLRKLDEYLKSLRSIHAEFAEETESLQTVLGRFGSFLKSFFLEPGQSQTYWLQFNSEWVDLASCPSRIEAAWQKFQSRFSSTTIVDTTLPQISLAYYQRRLGLEGFEVSLLSNQEKIPSLEIVVPQKPQPFSEIVKWCTALSGRSVVVVPNQNQLTEFLEIFTKLEKPQKQLLAYQFSGNLTLLHEKVKKMDQDGLLLLTLNVLLKNFPRLPEFSNLILLKLPFEAPGKRPDIEPHGQNRFLDHVLPRSVTILHTLLSRFLAASSLTKRLYLLDGRIFTDYNQIFLKYFQELPNSKISTT